MALTLYLADEGCPIAADQHAPFMSTLCNESHALFLVQCIKNHGITLTTTLTTHAQRAALEGALSATCAIPPGVKATRKRTMFHGTSTKIAEQKRAPMVTMYSCTSPVEAAMAITRPTKNAINKPRRRKMRCTRLERCLSSDVVKCSS